MARRLRGPAPAAERGEEEQVACGREQQRVAQVLQHDRGAGVLIARGEAGVAAEAVHEEGAGQEDEQEVELLSRDYAHDHVVVEARLLRVLLVDLEVHALLTRAYPEHHQPEEHQRADEQRRPKLTPDGAVELRAYVKKVLR